MVSRFTLVINAIKNVVFHPLQLLKRIVPRGLFARSLIILMMPLLIVQISLGYVFFERHTETILRTISNSISGNIAMIVVLHEQKQLPLEQLQALASQHMALDLTFSPEGKLDKTGQYRDSWLYTPLMQALGESLNVPFYVRITLEDVIISVQVPTGVFDVKLQRKLLFSRTTPLVLIWTTVSAIILFIVASLFMRNQIRPIRRLAQAAEQLGRGNDHVPFKPEGAAEVRKAGQVFMLMRERVKRLLCERLEMLAGVSHDLRTPITRLKLAAAMIKDTQQREQITQDVAMLHEMVEGFLAYAKGVSDESRVQVNLYDWVREILRNHTKIPIYLKGDPTIFMAIKTLAVNRCLTNLIVNSEKNAHTLHISIKREGDMVILEFDDDGPGIAEHERENVFKPFYRIDQSRNLDSVGTGLGLSVARDIVLSHGGVIELDQSHLGGLKVKLTFPL